MCLHICLHVCLYFEQVILDLSSFYPDHFILRYMLLSRLPVHNITTVPAVFKIPDIGGFRTAQDLIQISQYVQIWNLT